MSRTFAGGGHPAGCKQDTRDKRIRKAKLPERAIMSLSQHTGTPVRPVVKVGDQVKTGQLIADCDKFISAPVHSGITGKVTAIERLPHPVAGMFDAVVVEGDGHTDDLAYEPGKKDFRDTPAKDIIERIRKSGIVGLGGAMFPTHVKLSPPEGKTLDTVIINGAECEPYLSCDHRLMIERPKDILRGLEVLMYVTGVDNAYIGIETNKQNAIASMRNSVTELFTINRGRYGSKKIKVVPLQVKYPQGAEKQLIKAVSDREVPRGGLPFDVGCLVQNVGTTLAIKEAVLNNKPLYERVITVCWTPVREPSNLSVRIGTPASDLIDECGGLKDDVGKIVFGGPMTGIAQFTFDVPVIKGTSGILLMNEKESRMPDYGPCIRCGKCLEVCPARISPAQIGIAVENGNFIAAKGYDVTDCMECGLCTYVCPCKRPLLQMMKEAKNKIIKGRSKI
jgi:electron transport complex protein RnfC